MSRSGGPAVALALSGGGAAGLGHIPVLEALDDLGVRVAAIAGSSVGALIGAGYAAGMTGTDLRGHVMGLARSPSKTARKLWKELDFKGLSAILSADPEAAIGVLEPDGLPERIEDLRIPLTVMATDYHARASWAFTEGPLRPALAASIAIPGVFRPVSLGGRVYVDGGVTNNLPLDRLPEGALCIGVDVASEPPSDATEVPGGMAATVGSMRIMMRALLERTLETRPPTVLIEPASRRFGALEFWKAAEILEAADHAREDTRRAVARALEEAGA